MSDHPNSFISYSTKISPETAPPSTYTTNIVYELSFHYVRSRPTPDAHNSNKWLESANKIIHDSVQLADLFIHKIALILFWYNILMGQLTMSM